MRIQLSPQGAFDAGDASPIVDGDTLLYRDQLYDFSPLAEGATIEIGSPFLVPVRRADGVVHVTLEYIYNLTESADNQARNHDEYRFDVLSGKCPCPIIPRIKPEPVAEPEAADE